MSVLLLGDIVPRQRFKSNIGTDISLLLLNLEAPIIVEAADKKIRGVTAPSQYTKESSSISFKGSAA